MHPVCYSKWNMDLLVKGNNYYQHIKEIRVYISITSNLQYCIHTGHTALQVLKKILHLIEPGSMLSKTIT